MKGSWVSFRLWRTHRFAAATGSLKCQVQGFSPNHCRKVRNDPHGSMRILYTLSQCCPIKSSKSVKISQVVAKGPSAAARFCVLACAQGARKQANTVFSRIGAFLDSLRRRIQFHKNDILQPVILPALKGNLKKPWVADRNLSFYSKSYHISKWDCTNRRFKFADNGGSCRVCGNGADFFTGPSCCFFALSPDGVRRFGERPLRYMISG